MSLRALVTNVATRDACLRHWTTDTWYRVCYALNAMYLIPREIRVEYEAREAARQGEEHVMAFYWHRCSRFDRSRTALVLSALHGACRKSTVRRALESTGCISAHGRLRAAYEMYDLLCDWVVYGTRGDTPTKTYLARLLENSTRPRVPQYRDRQPYIFTYAPPRPSPPRFASTHQRPVRWWRGQQV